MMVMREPVTTVSWRRERDRDTRELTGAWVLFGPATLLRPGQVQVTKRGGEVQQVMVARVSRAFDVDGVACCYGWPVADGDQAGIEAAMGAMRAEAAPQPAPTGTWTAPPQPAPAPQAAQDGWSF